MDETLDVTEPQEKYKPTRTEIIEAESHMTEEQRATSGVRQIFIESEHRILELPADLEYTHLYSNATRATHETISGTFNGRKLKLGYGTLTGNYFGDADEQNLSPEEVKSIWTDIHPVVLAFDVSEQAEEAAARKIRKEIAKSKVRPEDIGPYEPHQFRIKDENLAHEMALKEDQQMTETRKLLDEKIKQIGELSDADRAFLDRIKEEIVKLSVLEYRSDKTFLGEEKPAGSVSEVPRIRSWDREGNPTPTEKYDEYSRKADLLFQLLGVDKEKSQKWTNGFGVTYVDSIVYETIFPDIILRESYDTEYQRVGAGSQIYIERNSRYR